MLRYAFYEYGLRAHSADLNGAGVRLALLVCALCISVFQVGACSLCSAARLVLDLAERLLMAVALAVIRRQQVCMGAHDSFL